MRGASESEAERNRSILDGGWWRSTIAAPPSALPAIFFNIPIGRKSISVRIIRRLQIATVCACLLATGLLGRASGYQLGDMQANQILFLGNSITFCPQPPDQVEWWGLSASDPNHDYAHLLTQKINAATGGSLAIVPPNPSQGSREDPSSGGETRWYYGDPLPNYNGNIINICDLFETQLQHVGQRQTTEPNQCEAGSCRPAVWREHEHGGL